MSYKKGYDTPEQYIDLALEEFGRGFASKAEQKEAMTRLSRAYEFYRKASVTKSCVTSNSTTSTTSSDLIAPGTESSTRNCMVSTSTPLTAYPMELASTSVRRSTSMPVYSAIDIGPKVEYIMNLRAQFKDTEITPREKSAVQIMIEEERAAAKAVKDDGFRLDQWITTQAWDCVSHLGNPYYRVNWYKEGEGLVSFARICKFVAPRRQFWESKGKPNMSEWAYGDIVNFYAEVQS